MYYVEWFRIGMKVILIFGEILSFVKEKEEKCIAREERARLHENERRLFDNRERQPGQDFEQISIRERIRSICLLSMIL
jgi:hypothetical protein